MTNFCQFWSHCCTWQSFSLVAVNMTNLLRLDLNQILFLFISWTKCSLLLLLDDWEWIGEWEVNISARVSSSSRCRVVVVASFWWKKSLSQKINSSLRIERSCPLSGLSHSRETRCFAHRMSGGALFFKKWANPGLFLFIFCSFLLTISKIQIEKSVNCVLGIRTRGCSMVGTDETTELWRPPGGALLVRQAESSVTRVGEISPLCQKITKL